MKYESLIEELASDMPPTRRFSLASGWMIIAALLAIIVAAVLLVLEARPDVLQLNMSAAFLWKIACTALFGAAATHLVLRSAQPQFRVHSLKLAPVLIAAIAFILPALLVWLTKGMPSPMLETWDVCLKATTGLGLVMLGAMLLWLRHGAPSHAGQAGLLAGLASGAWAGFAYSMHCGHDELFYAGIWYTLVSLVLGGIGWFAARRLCKW